MCPEPSCCLHSAGPAALSPSSCPSLLTSSALTKVLPSQVLPPADGSLHGFFSPGQHLSSRFYGKPANALASCLRFPKNINLPEFTPARCPGYPCSWVISRVHTTAISSWVGQFLPSWLKRSPCDSETERGSH